MIIYFCRHASAGQRKLPGRADERRPLDEEGIEQCRMIGRTLAALNASVDVIISSPLKRATQTAALVGNELGHEGRMELDKALRPESQFAAFRDLLRKHASREAIMVVGHNPNLSLFLGRVLAGGEHRANTELKKCAVAKVQLDERTARLHWLITPKIVRAIYDSSAESSAPNTSRK